MADNSNSESEFSEKFKSESSENGLSDTVTRIKTPTVMQIIRNWALQEVNVPKSPMTSVAAV